MGKEGGSIDISERDQRYVSKLSSGTCVILNLLVYLMI
jgi:hypothetical protein